MNPKRIKWIFIIAFFYTTNIKGEEFLFIRYEALKDAGIEQVYEEFLYENINEKDQEYIEKNLFGQDNKKSIIFVKDNWYEIYLSPRFVDPNKLALYLNKKYPVLNEEMKISTKAYNKKYIAYTFFQKEEADSNSFDAHLKTSKSQLVLGGIVENFVKKINVEGRIQIGESGSIQDYILKGSFLLENILQSSGLNLYLSCQYVNNLTYDNESSNATAQGQETVQSLMAGSSIQLETNSSWIYLDGLKITASYYIALTAKHTDIDSVEQSLSGDSIELNVRGSITKEYNWYFEAKKRTYTSSNSINISSTGLGLEYSF